MMPRLATWRPIVSLRGAGTCLISRGSTVRVDIQAKGAEFRSWVVNLVPNIIRGIRSKHPVCSEQAARTLTLAAAQYTRNRSTAEPPSALKRSLCGV